MASNDIEVPPPQKGDGPIEHDLLDSDGTGEDQPTAPDQFDPQFETTVLEKNAYYAYYVGNNGLSLFNFAPTGTVSSQRDIRKTDLYSVPKSVI